MIGIAGAAICIIFLINKIKKYKDKQKDVEYNRRITAEKYYAVKKEQFKDEILSECEKIIGK